MSFATMYRVEFKLTKPRAAWTAYLKDCGCRAVMKELDSHGVVLEFDGPKGPGVEFSPRPLDDDSGAIENIILAGGVDSIGRFICYPLTKSQAAAAQAEMDAAALGGDASVFCNSDDDSEPRCAHCGKAISDASEIGCSRCDARHPEFSLSGPLVISVDSPGGPVDGLGDFMVP